MDTVRDIMDAAAMRIREKDVPGALAILHSALQKRPSIPQLWEFQAYLAATAGDHTAAMQAYQALFDLDPSDLTARINLATALVANDRLSDAEAIIV